MKLSLTAFAGGLVLAAALAGSVGAATPLYPTETAATQSCGSDEVVWVDLDRGKFYHKTQAGYAKSNNGGYACMKAAHSQYRESHD